MKQTLTIVCKLQPRPEQSIKIDKTLQGFADACNYVNKKVDAKLTNKHTIQNLSRPKSMMVYLIENQKSIVFEKRVKKARSTSVDIIRSS
jgi:hypothetical protein